MVEVAIGLIVMNITIISNIKINYTLPYMCLSLVWNLDIFSFFVKQADLVQLHSEIVANALLRPEVGSYDTGTDWRKDKNPLHSAMLYNTVSERTISYPMTVLLLQLSSQQAE